MVRRAYEITVSLDERIGELAYDIGVDKSEVVRMALQLGLDEVRVLWEAAGAPVGMKMTVDQLIAAKQESIKASSAKRRS